MKNAALLLVLVLAAAIGGMLLLSDRDPGSGDTRVDPTTADAAPPGGADDTSGADEDLVRVDSKTDRDAREAAALAEAPGAARVLERADDGAEARPPGTIVGRVTDGAGRPLADAEVVVALSDTEGISRLAFLRPGEERESKTLTTDSEGRFEVTVEVPRVVVTVGFDGFAPLERPVDVAPGATQDLGDMRLAEGVRLRGRVLDARGQGVARAEILRRPKSDGGLVLYGGVRAPAIAVTDDEGRFEIARQAAGPYEFDVVHVDHPAQSFAGRTERPGDTRDGLVVTLRDGATIEGIVIGFPPASSGALRVYAAPAGGAGGETFVLPTRPGGPLSAAVDREGRFTLTGLEVGDDVRLTLHHGQQRFDGSSRRARAVTAAAGDRDVRVAYSEGATVRFRVVDALGAPIESVLVDAGFEFVLPRIREAEITTGGECVVGNLWPDDAGETLRLEVASKGFDRWKGEGIVVHPEADIDLGDVTLSQRPQVVLTVTSATTGEPVVDAAVTMRPYRDPAAARRQVRRRVSIDADADGENQRVDVEGEARGVTDADGRCSLDANPGAIVELHVVHPDHAETVDGPLTIASSSPITEHSLALEIGGSVRVTVLDPTGAPVSGARVERRSAERRIMLGGDDPAPTTDDEGRLSFTGLAPGDEYFRLKPASLGGGGGFLMDVAITGPAQEDDGAAWTKATVVAGDVADIVLEAPLRGVISGVVEELGVPLASASITLRRPKKGPVAGMMAFGPQGPKVVSDARGEFTFDDVEEGEYELVVSHATRAMEEVRPIDVEGTETEVTIDLDVTVVEGVVFDEAGTPIAGALVRAEKASGGEQEQRVVALVMVADDSGAASVISSGGTSANETRTDDDGKYSLRGVAASTPLEIEASADGYDAARSETFEVDAGATRDGIDVRFSKPGKLHVTLENGPGSAMVMLSRRGEFGGEPRIEQLTGDSTTIEGVGPGDWTVRLVGGPNGEIRTDPDEVDVTVVAGETATAAFVAR